MTLVKVKDGNGKESKRQSARTHLILIAIVFFGPLAVAAVMYYGGYLQPEGRTNHGALLEPMVNVVEQLPDLSISKQIDGYWVLVHANDGPCADACRDALYTVRQSRLMLGQEMGRLKRLFLHGESSPDTVFLADQHAGLITHRDSGFYELLENKKPAILPAGGYFLIDPLGNLVMYFEPGTDPGDMVEDIKRLLKLSRIG